MEFGVISSFSVCGPKKAYLWVSFGSRAVISWPHHLLHGPGFLHMLGSFTVLTGVWLLEHSILIPPRCPCICCSSLPGFLSLHSDIKPELVLEGPAQESPCPEASQHPRHRLLSLALWAPVPPYLFFFLIILIYKCLAVLGLRHYTGFSPAAASRGYSLAGARGVLIAVASFDAEHGVRACAL